ncbi:MAG: hypothetical protein P4N59_30785 [Negativicutes bacterium]|nr:hypothetical protein [Negativicutes bacterium]
MRNSQQEIEMIIEIRETMEQIKLREEEKLDAADLYNQLEATLRLYDQTRFGQKQIDTIVSQIA